MALCLPVHYHPIEKKKGEGGEEKKERNHKMQPVMSFK